MDKYPVNDFLEFIRKREEKTDDRPRCKKCNRCTLDKTSVCFRCKQKPSSRKPLRKKCERCDEHYVTKPRLLCRDCRLPQFKKEQRLKLIKEKIAKGRCVEKGCRSKAMPNSKTCIRH